jgi:hypothetical protein
MAKLASSQNRVLRGEGRPTMRSVDRECAGRVMEPRNRVHHGSRRGSIRGRPYPRAVIAWFKDSGGVEEQGMCTGGPSGTWEALSF